MNISAANHCIDSGARFTGLVDGVSRQVIAFRAATAVAFEVVVGNPTSLQFATVPKASLQLDGTPVTTRANFIKYSPIFLR